MSYPYVLDLSFGSEKATADPIAHVAVSATSSAPVEIPTTRAELETLISEGTAVGSLTVNSDTKAVEGISEAVAATLPDNLLGVVTDDGTSDPAELEYTADGSTITITSEVDSNVAIILKQPLD